MNVFHFHERPDVKADLRTENFGTLAISAAIDVHRHLGPDCPRCNTF
ncbi:MAG TPA: hypothetical protein VGR35_00650 [Tepidisphaeraceae bacterium]|nr:hypothetical protein [Tepidisphaeraceae bacterium]